MISGAAIILRYGAALIFELQKRRKWQTSPTGGIRIGMGCIGGSLEDAENPMGTLQREAVEEIGCSVSCDASSSAFRLSPTGVVSPLEQAPPGVRFVWDARDPAFEGLQIAVYSGTPTAEPAAVDLPGVIALPMDIMLRLGTGPLCVCDALGAGGRLWESTPIPRDAEMEPVGTVAVLLELYENHRELADMVLATGRRSDR